MRLCYRERGDLKLGQNYTYILLSSKFLLPNQTTDDSSWHCSIANMLFNWVKLLERWWIGIC